MKKNRMKALLVVSLSFNAAVLAVFSFLFFSQHVHSGDNGLPATSRVCEPHQCVRFARRFGLHPEKAEIFADKMAYFSDEEAELRVRIAGLRGELMELLHDSRPDEDEIMKKIEEISHLQGRLEKILAKRLLRVNSVLSVSEREKLHKLLRHRMRGMMHGGGRPPRHSPPHPVN